MNGPLDDVCAAQNAVKEGADQNLKQKLSMNCSTNQFFETSGVGFKIHHYAGTYSTGQKGLHTP